MKIEQMLGDFLVETLMSPDSDEWIVRVVLKDRFIKFFVNWNELGSKAMKEKLEEAKKLLLEDLNV